MSAPISTKIQSEIDQLLARSFIYQMISFLLRPPSPETDDFQMAEEAPECRKAIDALDFPQKSHLKNSLELLIQSLQQITSQQWLSSYQTCFGHTAYGPVPIYELEYGEEHSHRQPQQLADISAFYHAFGLKMNEKVYERVDHAAVECEFMQYILLKEAYALTYGQEEKALICRGASERFLRDHLGLWVPSFCLKLAQYDRYPFMKNTAHFVLNFISQDCQKFGITPGPADLPLRAVVESQDEGCVDCSISQKL